jgi:Dolichyl-phosphate-mannose-protein mannosyltransferase
MGNRRAGGWKVFVWGAWLAVVAVLVAEPFRWEVEYFRVHGSRAYFLAILALLLLMIPVCILYLRLRRGGLYHYELPVIAGGALLLAAVEQPRALGVALLMFLACLAAGLALVHLFGVAFTNDVATVGMGFALGTAALIPVLFILGMLHAYYWPVFLLLLVAPLVFGWRYALEGMRAIGRLGRSASHTKVLAHPLCGIGVIFLAIGVLCGTMAALTPTLVMDALKMHLPSTQAYVALHAFQPVPELRYSYFPQGFEVLLATAYALGAQPAAQLVTPAFFLAFLLVLFEVAKLCGFDSAGILCGVAALLVTPFILWDGSQVKNDVELCLFQVAALYCCLCWRESGRRSWLLLGGLLLGASFGIKHTAAFGAVPLTLLFIAPLYRKPRGLRMGALFFLFVLAFGFYWHVRTYLLTGDPLYPRRVEEAIAPRQNVSRAVRLGKRLAGPWLVQLNDTRLGFESPLRSPMGILLLTFAPLALLMARKQNKSRAACWFYITVYLLLWGSRMTTLRYALAPIALLIVMVAAKVKEAYDQDWAVSPGLVRFSVAGAFGVTLAFGLLGTILVELVPGQLSLLAGRISPADYLKSNLPIYAPLDRIRHLDSHAAVFILKGCPRAYAPDPVASVCASTGGKFSGRIVDQLRGGSFQYVILPVDYDDDDSRALFSGWNTEDVYADDDLRGVRITRNP